MTQQGTAIVTGGSKGIGAAIARRLAEQGIAVAVNYSSDAGAADAVVDAIEANGGKAVAIRSDIAAPGGMTALFDATEDALGPVDILVNNAGIMRLSPLAQADDAAFDAHVALNIGAVFRGMREAANRMRDGGRIVSLSSSVVGLYQPGYGIYAATKAAVEALTHVLAKELGPRGITVNAIAPGPVETELFLRGKTAEAVAAIEKMNPQGRLGAPEDIAAAVALLTGPDGGWISGQTIRANGGVI
ncbi:3-oxoacyl-[acyl-carrier-protein] reductase FabG [Marinibacterium anthonyi]|nr:3-oxoacyl-[acyl-carrier-protein] reductase FabG [Marinibacterium anthonyi]